MQESEWGRRRRILAMAEADAEYQKMKAEYDKLQVQFAAYVDEKPDALRDILYGYPGMFHFMHNRILTLVSQNMQFLDEDGAAEERLSGK